MSTRNNLIHYAAALLLVLALTQLSSAQTPINRLELYSERGEYVGDGKRYLYTDGQFITTAGDNNKDGLVDYVRIEYRDNRDIFANWSLGFGANRQSGHLAPGFYDCTDPAAYAGDGPGLDVSGMGRGYGGRIPGKFTVIDAQYDYSGDLPKVLSFAIIFEQHSSKGILYGSLYYNSAAPGFAITVDPPLKLINAGKSFTYQIGLSAINGFTGSVAISAAAKPASSNIELALSQNSLAPGQTATLTVKAAKRMPASLFNIVITGSGAALTNSATASLTVVPKAKPDFGLYASPVVLYMGLGKSADFSIFTDRLAGFSGNVTITAPDTSAFKINLAQVAQSPTETKYRLRVRRGAKRATTAKLVFTGTDSSGRVRACTLFVEIN